MADQVIWLYYPSFSCHPLLKNSALSYFCKSSTELLQNTSCLAYVQGSLIRTPAEREQG